MARLAHDFFSFPPADDLCFDMSGGESSGFIGSSHLQGNMVQDWRGIVSSSSYPVKVCDVHLLRFFSPSPDQTLDHPNIKPDKPLQVNSFFQHIKGMLSNNSIVVAEKLGLTNSQPASTSSDAQVVFDKMQQSDTSVDVAQDTFSTFFSKTGSDKQVTRAIFIDLEPLVHSKRTIKHILATIASINNAQVLIFTTMYELEVERMACQFANTRSDGLEERNGVKLPSYRGYEVGVPLFTTLVRALARDGHVEEALALVDEVKGN
jgi:pentatricopeptide repeat protein